MHRPTWTISWNEELNIGIPEVDEDHKPIILFINELNRSITDGKSPAEIKRRLELIIDDSERHFNQEERLFQEWQYPERDGHSSSHAHILIALKKINEGFIPYGLDSSWVNIGLTVKRILLDHFLHEDVKFLEFFRNFGKVH